MSKKLWLAIFVIAGLLYAYHEGYLSDILKQPSLEKAISHVQSKLEQTVSKRTSPSNPKEAYLKSYPVKVWYEFKTVQRKDVFLNKIYTEKVVRLYFENTGSESVSFVIGGVAIVDDSGNQYAPESFIAGYPVTIYPGAKKYVDVEFKTYPKKGKLYIDIYKIGDVTVGWGQLSTKYKKLETVCLYFEAK